MAWALGRGAHGQAQKGTCVHRSIGPFSLAKFTVFFLLFFGPVPHRHGEALIQRLNLQTPGIVEDLTSGAKPGSKIPQNLKQFCARDKNHENCLRFGARLSFLMIFTKQIEQPA